MKRFKVKFINEEAIVQPAVVSADTTQEEMGKNEDEIQTDALTAATTPTIQAQDVEKMDDKDVMNYVYFNASKDIDDSTRQALFNRADEIRQKQMNGNMTPADQEKFAAGVISAAAQSKKAAKLGESISYGVKSWVEAISGKRGNKGRNGFAIWNGVDLFEEVEEEDKKGTHYFNEWIGRADHANKIIFVNDEVASAQNVSDLVQAARELGYKVRKTTETKEREDMGYEDDDDPMFTEAYSSGRVDTFDEPTWADMDGHFDDNEEDATYRPSYIPSQTSDEFMKSDAGKRAKVLFGLKDSVADRIEELTDGEYDYETVYDFVDDYLNKAHAKYSGEELKKHARVYDSKVDFFAKVILMKFKKTKAVEE